MLTDIEIAQKAELLPIGKIAERAGIEDQELERYGHYKAKVDLGIYDRVRDHGIGKLIYVTAINPTPAGEGKTCTAVGITEALGRLDKKVMLCLREPSLGPTFGIKGGAAGADIPRYCPWRTSTFTSPGTSTPWAQPTICSRPWSTTILSRATPWGSIPPGWYGAG